MELRYCFTCDGERPVGLESRDEGYQVRGEEVRVQVDVCVCSACNRPVSDEVLDAKALLAVFAAYRTRHGLLQPEEIASLRSRYGLSQRATARLLGWGLVTIQRYEQGALQDAAHEAELRRLYDPRYVLELADRPQPGLSTREREAVRMAARSRLEAEQPQRVVQEIETGVAMAAVRRPDLHGRQEFSLERLGAVVMYFSARTTRLYKTKLAKLLWLADFAHFREQGASITGLAYARLPHGPVPDDYGLLLGALEKVGAIRLQPQGESGEVVSAQQEADVKVLTDSEREVLDRVSARFGEVTGAYLSRRSHREAIWQHRADGDLLPYDEAGGIRLLKGV